MKKVAILTVLFTLIILSCTDRDDNLNTVNIRIENNTALFFTEVRVAQRDTVYENIAAGEFSEYLEYDEAYQNAAITVLTDSTTLNYFPEETPIDSLPIGFYTYKLSLNTNEELELTFRIDE